MAAKRLFSSFVFGKQTHLPRKSAVLAQQCRVGLRSTWLSTSPSCIWHFSYSSSCQREDTSSVPHLIATSRRAVPSESSAHRTWEGFDFRYSVREWFRETVYICMAHTHTFKRGLGCSIKMLVLTFAVSVANWSWEILHQNTWTTGWF